MRDVKIVETTRLGVLGVEQGVSAALVPLPIPDAMMERAAKYVVDIGAGTPGMARDVCAGILRAALNLPEGLVP